MALSPNYGWAEPDNSSLVKNGAQDIRALGDAIDTSVWNVGYGQAAKNKIINGDFSINQRNLTSTTSTGYGFDRWLIDLGGDGTTTWSTQAFTTGAAPVAGYESTNFSRIVTTGQTSSAVISRLTQKIENVRTFAGQTITVSFWAKAATGTPSIAVELQQNFGTGGSPSATVNAIISSTPKLAISTSWARYSFTIAVPSIAGKTIGTNNDSVLFVGVYVSAGSNFNARTGTLGIQSNTFDIWGVQAEYGSKATPFQTASGGRPQAELAMCQRYYYRTVADSSNTLTNFGTGVINGSTAAWFYIQFPQTFRGAASSIDFANISVTNFGGTNYPISAVSFLANRSGVQGAGIVATISGGTAGQFCFINSDSSSTGYLGFNAEL
jgi:hypothetical protein